ncbi:MAG: AraC family transcriptional regulator, partial [Bifidobacteriaceae bacterium]|nr:AraC family transcriptional regulator [Bifidobacteriaceae bacterium]
MSQVLPFCGRDVLIRRPLAPVAFDWLEVIAVRAGTGVLVHRDEGFRERVREGDVVVLLPNVPCRIEPEGQVGLTRLFYRPAFVVEQIRWAEPIALPDQWAALSRFERAAPSQVVRLGPGRREEFCALADKITRRQFPLGGGRGHLRLASWALGVLGIIEDQLVCDGAHGLFLGDDEVVGRPTEPCFGSLRPLRPEVRLAMKLIQERYMDRLPLDEIARAACLSRPQIARVFTEQVGKTPKAYQDLLRVKHMVRLLVSANATVRAAAEAVGWRNASRAARVFKEATTMLPSE